MENRVLASGRKSRWFAARELLAVAVVVLFVAAAAQVMAIDLPQTGQSACFNAAGAQVDCAGSGQDGAIRAGVAWPSPRFGDSGNGTVTDHLTGLIWLQKGNCYDFFPWGEALKKAEELAHGLCGLTDGSTPGDWRLPNILELESLSHFDFHRDPGNDPPQPMSLAEWLNRQGFSSVWASAYWSSTTAPNHADRAYYLYLDSAYTHFDMKANNAYFLAVRGIADGPAPLGRTGQTTPRADGDDGTLQQGVAWPSPRFVDHADGTVTDQLTGLVWLKRASCANAQRNWTEALADLTELNAAGTMNGQACGDISHGGGHQSDWRLPNIRELRSHNDFSTYGPIVPSGHPFTGVASWYYWSSTSLTRGEHAAWVVDLNDGYTNFRPKEWPGTLSYVWPVRGGTLPEPPGFAGGDGSADNPWQIATAEQLDAVRHFPAGHFLLLNDIDLDVAPYNTDAGWEPIGAFAGWENPANTPFTGVFDGAGHTISGLFVNRPTVEGVGLFGLVEGATIANLQVLDTDVTGRAFSGGLAGWLFNSTISDVFTSGAVAAPSGRGGGLVGEAHDSFITDSGSDCTVAVVNGTNAGGLVGQIEGTTIERSHATGVVAGSQDLVGGLVGEARYASAILACYATGAVTGNGDVGGLVGDLAGNSTIENSYATAAVAGGTAYGRIGGLVGRVWASTVNDSYATGLVQGLAPVGGLVGENSTGAITSSYYASDTTGQSDTGKGIPKTTAEMHQPITFEGWDFADAWGLVEGTTCPYLRWQPLASIGGVQLEILAGEEIRAGYELTVGETITRVQSKLADSFAGEVFRAQLLQLRTSETDGARAVAATGADGESRTWYEVYDAQTQRWEKASSTLALETDAFEAGSEIVIEKDEASGLQIRIETQVTRELHF
ncbi:MAG: DUF1566 domain-containing protein [Desulfuromonadales bacterium]|nr:DUF1566 domain-containing protein [Desulfuromonadales bacterium]